MLGGGAAAASQHVEETAGCELAQNGGRLLRSFIVFAEGVGQAGVRVSAHVGVGDARQFLDVGTQLLSAQRAVEADDGGPRMTNGIPEGLGGLARQGPAR